MFVGTYNYFMEARFGRYHRYFEKFSSPRALSEDEIYTAVHPQAYSAVKGPSRLSHFLQNACAYAEKQGKGFVRVRFSDGVERLYRFYKIRSYRPEWDAKYKTYSYRG